jgi:murein L,D-transpeptidase YcbB/YkuD
MIGNLIGAASGAKQGIDDARALWAETKREVDAIMSDDDKLRQIVDTRYSVRWINERLNEFLGADLPPEMPYNELVQEYVKEYQRRRGLELVDGWVGPKTLRKMIEENLEKSNG